MGFGGMGWLGFWDVECLCCGGANIGFSWGGRWVYELVGVVFGLA